MNKTQEAEIVISINRLHERIAKLEALNAQLLAACEDALKIWDAYEDKYRPELGGWEWIETELREAVKAAKEGNDD